MAGNPLSFDFSAPKLSPAGRRALRLINAKARADQDAQKRAQSTKGFEALRCVATFPRGTRAAPEELRLILGRYKGALFLSLRQYKRGPRRQWAPKGPPIMLRIGELPRLIRELSKIQDDQS